MGSSNPGISSSQTTNLTQVVYDSSSGNLTAGGSALGTAPLGSVANGIQTLAPNVSLLNGVISPSPEDRYSLNLPGQEQSVFYANGQYYNLYTSTTAAINFTYCSGDPCISTNWATPVQVLGNGTGGESGNARHGFAYVEGNTIYMYYIATAGIAVATATIPPAGTAPVFTKVGLVFTGVPSGGGSNGNCCVIKYQGTYYLFQECITGVTNPGEGNSNIWLISLLTCATPTGTFTNSIVPLQSIRPGPNASTSGGNVFQVGNTFVMYYHGGTYGRLFPNDIYRATIPASQIGTDNWTVTPPAGSATIPVNPAIMKRVHYYEFDQLADASVCIGPNGVNYLFYTACNNRNPGAWFQLMVTPILPSMQQVDGSISRQIWGPYAPQGPYWNNDDSWTWQNDAPNLLTNAAKKSGTWGLVAAASQYGGVLAENTSATSGDFIEYDVTLGPGTYNLTILYATGPGNGIYSFYIYDAVQLSPTAVTLDSYAASGANNVSSAVTLHIYGYETWRWRFRIACTSKNASSSGFLLSYSHLSIQRTGN